MRRKETSVKLRRAVAVLLVLVMLGSVVSPVVAATTANEANTCQCSSSTCPLTKNAKVSVVELKGIEKNEATAKALKDGDVKKLMERFVKKGHRPELARVVAKKVISEYGEATYVFIPFKAGKGYEKAGLAYVIAESGCKAYAAESYEKDGKKFARVYYINADGNIEALTVSTQSCTRECTSDCVVCCVCDNPYCQICGPLVNLGCAAACVECVSGNILYCPVCGWCSACYYGCAIWCCTNW